MCRRKGLLRFLEPGVGEVAAEKSSLTQAWELHSGKQSASSRPSLRWSSRASRGELRTLLTLHEAEARTPRKDSHHFLDGCGCERQALQLDDGIHQVLGVRAAPEFGEGKMGL